MNIVYLVLFVIGAEGITSQAIPQCQINARQFNTGNNKHIVSNGYASGSKTQAAMCIAGIK